MKDNYLKNTWNMIFYNFKTFMCFEFLFKIIISFIIMPITISVFNLIMKKTGYSYITVENISSFVWNPVTFTFVVCLLLFLAIIAIFDLSTMIVIFDESYHKNKISLGEAIKVSFAKCKNIFKFNNILSVFMIAFMIPFFNVGIESNVITSLKVPDFVLNFFVRNQEKFMYGIVFYFALAVLLFSWVFSLHYMIIEEKNFKNARRCSRELMNRHQLLDLIELAFGRIVFILLFILSLGIGYLLLILLHKIFVYYKIAKSTFVMVIWVLLVLTLLIFMILSNGVSYAIISSLFYKHKKQNKERIVPVKRKMILRNKKNNEAFPYFAFITVIVSMIGGSFLTYQLVSGQANYNIEFLKETEVTAHRGASVKYPENTMAAFVGAKNMGTDWIELDVQQTKDRKVIVSHDTNLYRTAGIDANIYDLTYDELKDLDVGSFLDPKYKDERIPLLSEVLEFARENGIRLNIEVKPTGFDVGLEEQVVDLIHKYHYEDLCVVSSQAYGVLENIKSFSDDITTLYIVAYFEGNLTDYDAADAYSVEALNVTEGLVHQVHAKGKEIGVWTANMEEDINEFIDINVDNITTDNIELCKELIVKRRSSNMIQDFVNTIWK